MKKSMKLSIVGGSLAVVALTGYLLVSNGVIYLGDKTNIMFDNSVAGQWKIKATTSSAIKELEKVESVELCITEKMIAESKTRTLEDKLNIKGLKCNKEVERISHEEGKFSLDCTGVNPMNDNEVTAKINGTVLSQDAVGNLIINYELGNKGEKPFKFQLKTESVRVGECKP